MKAFQTIFRQLRSVEGFSIEPAHLAGFSTSSYSCGPKKKKPYEEVDQARYSRLVKSVLTSRGPVRTPESLLEEDALLYGPVSKAKLPAQEETQAPGKWFPIFNPERNQSPNTREPSVPLKLPLQRNALPSVTRILQRTMTAAQIFHLERWRQRMILQLGEDGFTEYTSNLFQQGRRFHEAVESLLSGRGSGNKGDESLLGCGYVRSVQHLLKDVCGVRALESAVQHHALNYAGLLDCVAEYRGELCVIDWKTSEKPKPSLRDTYDNPLQVAAYVGALNYDANYSFQVQCGLIAVAYKDGSPAHAHFLDPELCSHYWAKWLLRLEEYSKKDKSPAGQELGAGADLPAGTNGSPPPAC